VEGSGFQSAADNITIDEKIRLSSSPVDDLDGTCLVDTCTDPPAVADGEEK
jgi:hypothetical protein